MVAERTTTHALLIGIERYAASSAWDLNGPASDVYRFADWLCRNHVPGENITVLMSPLERNAGVREKTAALTGQVLEATKEEVNKAIGDRLKATTASLFFLFWGGHGWTVPNGDHLLICADATQDDRKNLNLNAQLTAMRTHLYKSIPRQVFLVDACANYEMMAVAPPSEAPAIGTPLPSQEQFVLFAAKPGDYATNHDQQQTGLFSRELLAELNTLPDGGTWPPDMKAITGRLQRRFIELREQKQTEQTPSYFWCRDWSSSDRTFGQISGPPAGRLSLGGQKGIIPKVEEGYRYDAYISYADEEPDTTWVWYTLLPKLETAGLRVAVSGDSENPGVARVINIEQGMQQAKRTVVVLSETYLADHIAEFENTLGQTMGIQEGTYRLLPVRAMPLDMSHLPTRLSMLTTLDLTNPRRAEREFSRLIQALQEPLPRM